MPTRPKQHRPPNYLKQQAATRETELARQRAKNARLYNSSEWKNLRKLHLAQHPLCEECFKENKITPASDVHHLIDVVKRPDLKLDPTNLGSLCHPCHSRITRGRQ